MDIINEGRYEQNYFPSGSNSDGESSSAFETEDSGNNDKLTDDEEYLKEDLQKNIPDCYKSDSNITLHSNYVSNDEELQASALCQFMDILNDLDEVLDKSLLACLENGSEDCDSDDNELVCKYKEKCRCEESNDSGQLISIDDNCEVVTRYDNQVSSSATEDTCVASSNRKPHIALKRSKSYNDLASDTLPLTDILERNNTIDESIRNSMRRLDPIVLPALTADQACEPLTLPVILFLEHHVNMRPTSAPIQLQVTAANLSTDGTSGPLIVGRRALLMNRTLSLPSPGESDITAGWTGHNTSRSTARSISVSSSSSESLEGVMNTAGQPQHPREDRTEESDEPPLGVWPHRLSAMLACLSCTVGIFNISRFATFSVHFGASFIVQFFILSLLIGIPLFTLHLCLGQVLESGPVDMWRISPIFQGVGVTILVMQSIIGIYSMMGLSWIIVYLRDSFITSDDKYKWTVPQDIGDVFKNSSYKIYDTIPQYFHVGVLQRNLSLNNSFGTVKFHVAFHMAVVWAIVFIALSEGLRSYGKAVYILIFLPICGTLVLCTKLLTLIPYDAVTNVFAETDWSEFFVNSNSWAAAAQETFLTWGLLGSCIMQLISHKNAKHKTTSMLQKESTCIIAFTFAILLLSAFLANTCVHVLKSYGFIYMPGSFETVKSSQFLYPTSEPLPGNMASTPVKYLGHYASLVGITVWRSGNAARLLSGWQPLQLATQIVPATLAVLPHNFLSPTWAVLFFFILIMFGIAQQLAIWHCVIAGILAINQNGLKVWSIPITFLSCVFGLSMGILLSTDAGIKIVHFIDYVWIGSWLHCAIQVALTCGVFVVRGRPYSADVVVSAMYSAGNRLSASMAALLSFIWTVALPVLLCAICVMDFRIGQQRQLYTWRKPSGYWPIWARQIAVFMQQGALLLVPITAFIQTWRYLSKGPPDILERIQNLYRPRMGAASETPPARAPAPLPTGLDPPADPPPKYTPPPSYSTATAARLLNTMRRSFRTLRRITTSRPASTITHDNSQIPITLSETVDREQIDIQPPEYSGVFTTPDLTHTNETTTNRPRSSTSRNSLNFTREILRRSFVRKSDSVKNIRSSLRRSFKYGGILTTSNEHLVRDAEPISNTVAMSDMLDSEQDQYSRSLASVI